MKYLKYPFIIILSFLLTACNVQNNITITKEHGFKETNLTLTEYLLSVKGLGEENEELSYPLFCDASFGYSKVKDITITHRANDFISVGGQPSLGPTCKEFSMSEKELKRYFYIAGIITSHDKLKKLQWTDCYISGNLTFENGEKAVWQLDAFMQGSITLKSNKQSFYLYCPQCRYDFIMNQKN